MNTGNNNVFFIIKKKIRDVDRNIVSVLLTVNHSNLVLIMFRHFVGLNVFFYSGHFGNIGRILLKEPLF